MITIIIEPRTLTLIGLAVCAFGTLLKLYISRNRYDRLQSGIPKSYTSFMDLTGSFPASLLDFTACLMILFGTTIFIYGILIIRRSF